MIAASVGFQCPDDVKAGAATVRSARAPFGGTVRAEPVVTRVLIGLCVVLFVLTTGTGTGVLFGGEPSRLFSALALAPSVHGIFDGQDLVGVEDGVAQGQFYRLLTATFLHFGIIHIALNMFALYSMGPALERTLGRLRFAALYVLSGLSGSALSYALGPENQLAAGASGAVFGLFAAYFVLQRRVGADVSQIGVTIGINLFISFAAPFIDWRGHVGGLLGGALVTVAFVYAPAGPRRWLVQLAGAVGVLVLVVVLVVVRTAVLTA